jgi:4-hydroxy-3-polyprenylbenzoate decarboxylase
MDSLSDFLAAAEDRHELVRVTQSISRDYETSIYNDLLLANTQSKGEGDVPVIFFEDVTGADFPLVTQYLGSWSRVCLAARVQDVSECAQRIMGAFTNQTSLSWLETMSLQPKVSLLEKFSAKPVKQGVSQQVVRLARDIDLAMLPIPRHATWETQPVISRAIVHAATLDKSLFITRQLPVIVLDRASCAVLWDADREIARMIKLALDAQKPVFVSMELGGDPVHELACYGRLPTTISRSLLTGLLANVPQEVVNCRTNPMQVSAHAEFVLEGTIDPRREMVSVPRCHLSHGHASEVTQQPVVQLQALTHRANPIFPDIKFTTGKGELYWIGKFWERLMLSVLKYLHPEIIDIAIPSYGMPDQLLFVRIDKRKPHHARQIMSAIWGWGMPVTPRSIIVVDEDVDIQQDQQVWQAVFHQTEFLRDQVTLASQAELTDAVASGGYQTTRWGIDATRKWPEEGYQGVWPPTTQYPTEILARVQTLLGNP